MNSRWSIRSNLILINLIVIGLIAWLTVSFLYVAFAQRDQALELSNNIMTDKSVFNVSTALTGDRQLLHVGLLSPQVISQDDLKEFSKRAETINSAIEEMLIAIDIESKGSTFFKNTKTTKSNTKERLVSLIEKNRMLIELRKHAHAQLMLPQARRDMSVLSDVFEIQTDMLDSLTHLFRGMKYLPDSDASEVSKYHSILNEIIVISGNISLKNSLVSELIVSSNPPGTEIVSRLEVLSRTIVSQLDDLLMIAESHDNIVDIHSNVRELHDYYATDYSEVELTVRENWRLPDRGGISIDYWSENNHNLKNRLATLTNSTHNALENLASVTKTRATRNVVIDILLVGLCFLMTSASVAVSNGIKRLAYHDSLTNLPNRINFESALHAGAGTSNSCLLYTSPSPRDRQKSRMPSSA